MDTQEAIRIHTMFQDQEMKSVEDRATDYLELFRDEKYLELTNELKKEDVGCVATFCYYVARYEGVHHLEFVKNLLAC